MEPFNLVISFIFAVIAYCVMMFPNNKIVENLFFAIIAYRTLSRTLEINISFLIDIIDKKKNKSGLEKYDRIKLALTSLLEEAFLFVGVYAFFTSFWATPLIGGLHSFILNPFNLDSVKACGCKCVNAFSGKDVLFKFISIYQVICTVILITLSFAGYISESKEDKKDDSSSLIPPSTPTSLSIYITITTDMTPTPTTTGITSTSSTIDKTKTSDITEPSHDKPNGNGKNDDSSNES